jgi:hypothetical protein
MVFANDSKFEFIRGFCPVQTGGPVTLCMREGGIITVTHRELELEMRERAAEVEYCNISLANN